MSSNLSKPESPEPSPASTAAPLRPAKVYSWFRRAPDATSSTDAPQPPLQNVEAAAAAANKQATDWLEMRRAAGWEPLERNQAK